MTGREALFEAILAGVADLRRRADLLDRINVFPVVDADTGTNMLRTAEALAEAVGRGEPDPSRDAYDLVGIVSQVEFSIGAKKCENLFFPQGMKVGGAQSVRYFFHFQRDGVL